MNISLQGTKVTQDNKTLAFEKNNLVDDIIVTVDTDETWEYKLDVKYAGNQCRDDKYNVIQLERTVNTASIKLTADMLPFKGKYIMQLRGYTADGKVYHSETFDSWVKYSIDPSEVYEPLPSEFYQFERQIEKAVPKGGKKGQVLTKLSDDSGDAGWQTPTGGTGGGGVQSDWSQNDETQPDYVKNRPFYTGDPVETVLLAETTLNVQVQQNGVSILGVQNVDFAFEIGKTYKVSWDGTMYSCVAFDFVGSGYGAIGNQQIIGGADTGEPFIAAVDSNTLMIYTSDTATSHTVAISGYEPEIVKIDERYLPNYLLKDPVYYSGNIINWSSEAKQQMYDDVVSGKNVIYIFGDDHLPLKVLTIDNAPFCFSGFYNKSFIFVNENGAISGAEFPDGKIASEQYVDGKAIGMNITSATVGQLAKISAVDANGVPTAWEPVDMPAGGWVQICDVTITETDPHVAQFAVTTLPDGTPLEGMGLKEVIFAGALQIAEDASYSYGTFFVNDKSIMIGQNFGVNKNNKSWFRGSFSLLGDGYASTTWSNGPAANVAVSGGGININPHYYGAGTPDICDTYTNAEISSIKITGPKATSGADDNINALRLVMYGR